jgi:hypothetical protein
MEFLTGTPGARARLAPPARHRPRVARRTGLETALPEPRQGERVRLTRPQWLDDSGTEAGSGDGRRRNPIR